MAFTLYDNPEVIYVAPTTEWNPWGRHVSDVFSQRWLERFDGFDYGRVTAYLLRAYGLPNLRAYNTFKHSHTWGLDTGEGYVITIEPRLVSVSGYKIAPEGWGKEVDGKKDMVMAMAAHHVLDIQPIAADAPPLTLEKLDAWLEELARPIYVRDMGANINGPLWDQGLPDVGPNHPSVLDGGADSADDVLLIKANRKLCR